MASVFKNSALYLASTLCLRATSFILLPFYSYLITPDVYGKVFVVNALIAFLSMLLPMSLEASVNRFFFDCKSKDDEIKLFSTVTWTTLAFVLLFDVILMTFIAPLSGLLNIPKYYFFLALLTSSLSVFYTILTSFFYAKQEAKIISIVTVVVGIIQILAQLILVLTWDDKALALIYTFLINSLVSFIVFIYFARKYISLYFDRVNIKKYLVYGISQLPSSLSLKIVTLLDRFILNKFVNSYAVGLYGMGYSLGQIPNIIFGSVNSALAPTIFIDFKEDSATSYKRATNKVEITFILFTAFYSLLIVFSNNIVSILSDKYEDSGTIMALILVALLLDTYRMLFMYPMSFKVEYVKVKSAIWVLAAVLSTVLNILLIPRYSIYGAAFSFLLSTTITLVLIVYFSQKAIRLDFNISRLVVFFFMSICFSSFVFCGHGISGVLIKVLASVIYIFLTIRFTLKYYNFLQTEIRSSKYLRFLFNKKVGD